MRRKHALALAAALLALLLLALGALGWARTQKLRRQAAQAGIWQAGGHWGEALKGGGAESGAKFARKLLELRAAQFPGAEHVSCALIPDKGYYLQGQGAPEYDYQALFSAVQQGLAGSGVAWVDLSGALSASDYYTTDSPWRQERLQPVLDALGASLGFSVSLGDFQPNSVQGFVGAYGKYGAKPAEELVYLTSPATGAAVADNFQHPESTAVYDLSRLKSEVPYDVFLAGATPLVTITNQAAASARELVIFRDSYASSLAPLLVGEYRTITLVDIRYMASGLVPQYVDFTGKDVLFLYSVFVADQSAMLR